MAKKRLQRLVLATGLVFMTGYVAHLGGFNTQKARTYLAQVSDRAQTAYSVAKRAYNGAEPVVKDAYEKTEHAYRVAKPVVEKVIDHFQEKTDAKKKAEEEKKKQSDKNIAIAMNPRR